MSRIAEQPPVTSSRHESARIEAGPSLSTWSMYDWRDEVSLDRLSPFDRIVVTTRNHTYEIVVMSPLTGDVFVRGGRFFPRFTAAGLAGSSLGRSTLKMHSINVGFRLEFTVAGARPVVTSRVTHVKVVPADPSRDVM